MDSVVSVGTPTQVRRFPVRRAGLNSSLPNLDSRGLGWVRLWGYAGRPVLPSGAVPAFDREMGGSWPVTGLILAGLHALAGQREAGVRLGRVRAAARRARRG
jgi:hypothetical protein